MFQFFGMIFLLIIKAAAVILFTIVNKLQDNADKVNFKFNSF